MRLRLLPPQFYKPTRRGLVKKPKAILTVAALTGVIAITGQAQAHYKPKHFKNYSEKRTEFEHRKKHALDVERFFRNHPKLAKTKAGKKAEREHKELLAWSIRELNGLDSLNYIQFMSDEQLAEAGKRAIANGGTYSVRWGDCSNDVKTIVKELINRYFGPHGTERWAYYIVDRESGFCPGAVNTTYSDWSQQAQCVAQLIPEYHRWVDYDRCKTDPAYSVAVFAKLSRNGQSTGPWS